jgi:hypothetical protein
VKLSDADLRELVNDAEVAFWQVIAERFPQARTGDLSIDLTIRFSIVATDAAEAWIACNVP